MQKTTATDRARIIAQIQDTQRQAGNYRLKRENRLARVELSTRVKGRRGAPTLFMVVIFMCMIGAAWLLTSCAPRPVRAEVMVSPRADLVPAAVTNLPSVTATRTAIPSPSPVLLTCEVDTGFDGGTVYVRSGAGMGFEVVDVVQDGEKLVLNGYVESNWGKITTPRLVVGWFYIPRWCKKQGVTQ
jgi:hypothetical protein